MKYVKKLVPKFSIGNSVKGISKLASLLREDSLLTGLLHEDSIVTKIIENGKIKLRLPSHTKTNPREFVLEPQGNNKYYIHMRTWDGEKIPAKNLTSAEKNALFEAVYKELPEGAEILIPKSDEKYLATRGTVARLTRLSKDPRFEAGTSGSIKYQDKDGSIREFATTSFIKKGNRTYNIQDAEDGTGVIISLAENEEPIGYLQLDLTGKNPLIKFIENVSEESTGKKAKGISRDLYDIAIQYVKELGYDGIRSGDSLHMPKITKRVWEHYPSKKLIGKHGTHGFSNVNGEVYLLDQPSQDMSRFIKSAEEYHAEDFAKPQSLDINRINRMFEE